MWAATWRWAGRPTDKKLRQHPVRTIAARYAKAGSFKTRYWTPEVHVAAFALPRFIAEHVKSAKRDVIACLRHSPTSDDDMEMTIRAASAIPAPRSGGEGWLDERERDERGGG